MSQANSHSSEWWRRAKFLFHFFFCFDREKQISFCKREENFVEIASLLNWKMFAKLSHSQNIKKSQHRELKFYLEFIMISVSISSSPQRRLQWSSFFVFLFFIKAWKLFFPSKLIHSVEWAIGREGGRRVKAFCGDARAECIIKRRSA